MNKKVPSILIVEDERPVLNVLQSALAQKGYKIYTAESGEEALEKVVQYSIDLLILDVMLPGISGFEVCKWVREQIFSHLSIIIISGAGNEVNKVKALSLGADDYVTKPFSMPLFLARVKAHLRNHQPVGPIFTAGPLTVDFLQHRVHVHGQEVLLQPNEFQILKILIDNKDKLVTTDTLIFRLWPTGDDLASDMRVDIYRCHEQEIATSIHNLRKKIDRPAQHRFIITHHHMGYRFSMVDESKVH